MEQRLLNERQVMFLRPERGVNYIVMSMSVCVSVCSLTYLKNHMGKLFQFFPFVACSHGDFVLIWWHCDRYII